MKRRVVVNKRKLTPYEQNLLNLYKVRLDEVSNKDQPVEYIVNHCCFRERYFYINKNTLIPRIETERLIDLALERLPNKKEIVFADVGTGSGIIGISFALELLKRNIKFQGILSDVSKKALEVARKNSRKFLKPHKILISNSKKLGSNKNCVYIFKSDLLSNYTDGLNLDIVFSNLPYIPSTRIDKLPNSVKDFEPLEAIDGGEDGLKYIYKLMNGIYKKRFLSKQSLVLLEVDCTHNRTFLNKFYSQLVLCWKIDIFKDFNKKDRYWVQRPKYLS